MAYYPIAQNVIPKSVIDPMDVTGELLNLVQSDQPAADLPLTDSAGKATQLSSSAAASLGFGIGDASASYDRMVTVVEWRAWNEVWDDTHQLSLLMGYAIRYSVEHSAARGSGSINIPAIAAEATLERDSAQIQFSTRGIDTAPLVNLLPDVKTTLNVDTYAEYVGAINQIRQVVSAPGSDLVHPALIGMMTKPDLTLSGRGDQDLDRAVAISFALSAIAQGANLKQALSSWKGDETVAGLIGRSYEVLGATGAEVPDEAKTAAKEELLGYQLTVPGPWGIDYRVVR